MSVEQPEVVDGDTVPGRAAHVPASVARRRRRGRLNPLAIAALTLAILLSPLAALFGHIALGQISRSQGRERGAVAAWIAIALGYLWLIGLVIIIGAVLVALDGGGLPGL